MNGSGGASLTEASCCFPRAQSSERFNAGFLQVADAARWQVSGMEMEQFAWAKLNSAWNSPIRFA
jgi:hypothetical protein